MSLSLRISHRAASEIERAERWWLANRPAAPNALREDLSGVLRLLLQRPGVGVSVSNTRVVRRSSSDPGPGEVLRLLPHSRVRACRFGSLAYQPPSAQTVRPALKHAIERARQRPLNSWGTALASAVALGACAVRLPARAQAGNREPAFRWYEAAVELRRLAQSWGDQPYGAVLALDGKLVGKGPSRVVKTQNPDAHAEREAILDARRTLGRPLLPGAIL